MCEIESSRIGGDGASFTVVSKDEIERIRGMERSEEEVPLEILERGITTLKALGCHTAVVVSYYSLSDKGVLISDMNNRFGVIIKEKKI
jgi:hypothetical protein